MIAVLLWAQVAAGPMPDTATYSSSAVRFLVNEAARLNNVVPASLGRYRATVESEFSVGTRPAGGREMLISIEQMASELTWLRTGDFEQHVTGYRSQSLGMQFSSLGFLRYPYAVPALYGNRLALLFGRDSARRGPPPPRAGQRAVAQPPRTAGERVSGPRNPQRTTYAVHPLATDRERVYQYSGGDTVETLRLGDRSIRIVKIEVRARKPLPPRTTLFNGEIDLDLERKHVVRMRGSFATTTDRQSGPLGLFDATQLEGAVFVELVNSEVNQELWLPSYQRFDFQAMAATFGESKALFRIVSRFRRFEIFAADSTFSVRASDTLRVRPHVLTIAPTDSLARFRAWKQEIGELSLGTSSEDFTDVAPERWRSNGRPIVRTQVERFSDFLRFNRVEGAFTGLGVGVQLRDAAPGVSLRAVAGYAWSEGTLRGRAMAELRRGTWTMGVKASRSLDLTNDFRHSLDSGSSLGALFGTDDYDYVDRRTVGVYATRPANEQLWARMEIGWTHDAATPLHVFTSPLGRASYRANRAVTPGDYMRTLVAVELHPDAASDLMRPGVNGRLTYLRGDGALQFQRVETTIGFRHNGRHWSAAARLDAGALVGTPLPQQLFELGGEQTLAGTEYKQFAGDQAVLLRGVGMYHLRLLEAPLRLWKQLWLPAPAPAIAISAQSGWTGVSGAAAAFAVAALADSVTSRAATPVPSTTTGSARTTIAIGLRFFGGAVGVSAARSVDGAMPWRARLTLGQLF